MCKQLSTHVEIIPRNYVATKKKQSLIYLSNLNTANMGITVRTVFQCVPDGCLTD